MSGQLVRLGGKKTDRRVDAVFAYQGMFSGKSRVRVWPFVILLIVALVVLVIRLGQLTLVEGTYNRQRADENRMMGARVAAVRGVFLDRDGAPLVRNVPSFKRQVPGTTLAQAEFEPLTRDQALEYAADPLERVFFDVEREYLCGRACAPVLGYVGEINYNELNQLAGDYVVGDIVGKSGLEKAMEVVVRGKPGSQIMEIDAKGMSVREIGAVAAQAGVDVPLTIDGGLQQILYEALSGMDGAAVAANPKTGEILALVSSPAFEPNNVAASLLEPQQPFFNRALSGTYSPGSTFKVVSAVAGLEEGKVTGETMYEDTGEIKIDSYRFGNWYFDEYGKVEGAVDVVKALQRSNDIYFYRLGEAVGAELLAEWANRFGFGRVVGLSELGAVSGLVPTPEWKEKYKGERWFLGNTYHMAIGQGDVLATPLQVNTMMAAIANGGSLCLPRLTAETQNKSCEQLNLSEETIALVQEGLVKACESGGTGSPFFNYSPKVACKTGTAQQGGEKALPHAWFTVYAPAENPEIVITVLAEESGQGSTVAAPIAKKGLEYWFSKQ